MRGDEGSLKGVEQKVHATEFVVRSYISLKITDSFNTPNSVSPSKHGGRVAGDENSPLWGKSEGVLFPYDCAIGNVRCNYQAFPLLLVEVFHLEGETFLGILERIEAVEDFAGGIFKLSSGAGEQFFNRIGQTEAL